MTYERGATRSSKSRGRGRAPSTGRCSPMLARDARAGEHPAPARGGARRRSTSTCPRPSIVLDDAGQMVGDRRPTRATWPTGSSRSSCSRPTRRWPRSSRPRARRRSTASTSSPTPSASTSSREFARVVRAWAARQARGADPADFQAILEAGRGQAGGEARLVRSCCAPAAGPLHAESRGHFAPGQRRTTATSPRRSGAIPTSWSTASSRALRHGRGDQAEREMSSPLPEMGAPPLGRWSAGPPTPSATSSSGRRSASWRTSWAKCSRDVTGVQAFGLFVELDEIYVQGLVPFRRWGTTTTATTRPTCSRGRTRAGLPPGRRGGGSAQGRGATPPWARLHPGGHARAHGPAAEGGFALYRGAAREAGQEGGPETGGEEGRGRRRR